MAARMGLSLGTAGFERIPLGVGTAAWGSRLVWGYGRAYAALDLQAAFAAAVSRGVTLFDTAEIYGWGSAERLLGQFIAATSRQVAIATKFMPYPWRLRPDRLLVALSGSLDRLGVAAVDLYQMHRPWPPLSIETWMNAMADAVDTGLTRAVGVCNYDLQQMVRAHAVLAGRGVQLAANQVHYSLLYRDPEHNGLLRACQGLGVSLIAYSPLAMGVLAGTYTLDTLPGGLRGRRLQRQLGQSRLERLRLLLPLLREIGQAHGGRTPAQVALNWVICKGAVPIPGAKRAAQAEENAGAVGWRLSSAEIKALDAASS
ncbi:MAG: 2,5-didehydrogluconate reductase [Dehalococcoidia bacterium]|nr:2,5-didehydrogluconate reductase [Dehalococcoidia bacterium]